GSIIGPPTPWGPPQPLPPLALSPSGPLAQLARRDANAFAELYRRYVERIYAYAYRRSGSETVAEDVTSATFEKALRGLDRYRWREPGIGPWLFRIASNEFVNHHRGVARQERVVRSLQQAAEPGIDQNVSDVDLGDEGLRSALATIRPRYQEALTLRYFADLTNEEAAAAMRVSRRTMAVIVHRGLAALRRSLEAKQTQEMLSHGR
ncbi:MAG: RNA polymerase sigma factor, partial [Acidimicrobiales bacterium]